MMTEQKYRMFLSRNLDREKREKKIQDTQTRIWSLPLYKVENCLTSILIQREVQIWTFMAHHYNNITLQNMYAVILVVNL